MSFLDSVLGSSSDSGSTSSNPAVPGGISKPLMIALLALLARYMTSGSVTSESANPNPASASPAEASPGDVLGGLGGLLKQFQQNGFGDAINSWISTGQKKAVTSDQISKAIDPAIIEILSQRFGLSKEQLSQILSQLLPKTVDQLTPEGRLPTQQEMARLMG
jgi:uncharacterized protein YidB (DUF937 family)